MGKKTAKVIDEIKEKSSECERHALAVDALLKIHLQLIGDIQNKSEEIQNFKGGWLNHPTQVSFMAVQAKGKKAVDGYFQAAHELNLKIAELANYHKSKSASKNPFKREKTSQWVTDTLKIYREIWNHHKDAGYELRRKFW